jgi:hypothetical protein
MKRKLEVEALEDRYLATAGLLPWAPNPPHAVNSAAVQARPMNGADMTPAPAGSHMIAISSSSSHWHGGIRSNHNETLVRDSGCKRRKRRKRAARRRSR